MKTIIIQKDALKQISFKNESSTMVWIMLNVVLDMQAEYVLNDTVYVSLEMLWNSFTQGKSKLRDEHKKSLVNGLLQLQEDKLINIDSDKVTFKSYVSIKIKRFDTNNGYVCIRRDELRKMFTLKKFGDIDLALCTFIRIVSHGSGRWYYLDCNEIAKKLSHEHYFNLDKPDSWFVGMTKEELKDIKGLCFFPDKTDVINTRFDRDEVVEEWTTRPTLDRILKLLHEIGVLSEVRTSGGIFGNKIVFCKTQHIQLVEKYYERVMKQKAYSKMKELEELELIEEEEVVEQQQEEPTPTVKKGGSFVQARRDREFR